jgi:hypothetical protein
MVAPPTLKRENSRQALLKIPKTQEEEQAETEGDSVQKSINIKKKHDNHELVLNLIVAIFDMQEKSWKSTDGGVSR